MAPSNSGHHCADRSIKNELTNTFLVDIQKFLSLLMHSRSSVSPSVASMTQSRKVSSPDECKFVSRKTTPSNVMAPFVLIDQSQMNRSTYFW